MILRSLLLLWPVAFMIGMGWRAGRDFRCGWSGYAMGALTGLMLCIGITMLTIIAFGWIVAGPTIAQ